MPSDSLYKRPEAVSTVMVCFDPHKHEQTYKNWQALGSLLPEVREGNLEPVISYLEDMEIGANVSPSSKRGARSYGRLRNLRSKMTTWTVILQDELGMKSWRELETKDRDLLSLLKRMREGQILSRGSKKPLVAIGAYVKILKSFWHWYQRKERSQNREVRDITAGLDSRDSKPKFNYFTIDDARRMCNAAKPDYKMLMMLLFDSGVRAPTELMNIRVCDLEWDTKHDHYQLNIREETSKTFGRRIKLLLSSAILKEYIEDKKLKPEDYIFRKTPIRCNQYLKNIGFKILGIGQAEQKTFGERTYTVIVDGLTLYDFRHASACYWLTRYKSESALKYRFGWKKSDMIHYYTELLGMKDTIQEDDLYVDVTKTELERQIGEKGKEISILQDQIKSQDEKVQEIMETLKALHLERLIEQRIHN